jgi:hypothetical protein
MDYYNPTPQRWGFLFILFPNRLFYGGKTELHENSNNGN